MTNYERVEKVFKNMLEYYSRERGYSLNELYTLDLSDEEVHHIELKDFANYVYENLGRLLKKGGEK